MSRYQGNFPTYGQPNSWPRQQNANQEGFYQQQQQQPHPYQASSVYQNPSQQTASYPTFYSSHQQHPYQQNPHNQTWQGHGYQSLPYQYGQTPYNPSICPSAPVRATVNPNTISYQQRPYPPRPFQYPPPPYHDVGPPPHRPQSFERPVNLISSPNFEAKCWNENGDTIEINMAPWDIISTGGDGWRLEKRPLGSKVSSCPTSEWPGAHCVVGSFDWCKRSQMIDLGQKGFTPYVMDQEKPRIQVYEWFIARSDCDSEYYMKVALLDKDKRPIDHFNSGTLPAGSSEWQKVEHNFYNYPSGVRFIKFEDGTKDKNFWAGYFGAKMCQPTVLIHSSKYSGPGSFPADSRVYHGDIPRTEFPGASMYEDQFLEDKVVNLIKNPSFTPLKWTGDICESIDYSPWAIERNGGYCLERKPIGAGIDKYPAELNGFDIWCISTSYSFSERKQVVDLVQQGFSPSFLDRERPSIKIYEWFTSRSDCEGKYYLKVSLLDEKSRLIPGYCYETGDREAPSGIWHKEQHIFTNIPAGTRFIEFKDGGSDCKTWAGFYGVKMVGAFAGVITNKSFGVNPDGHRPLPRNLLENANLTPKASWNGNVTNDFEFKPWEILENGGDGIHLEKTAEGTAAGNYPRESGQSSHCIAASFGWFKRVQIIDLLKNGVIPHMFNNPDLTIYVCEWFASRTDNEGEYYLKASLLDRNKKEIPGYTFDSHVNKAPSDEWEKVDYTFFPVPETACYVRFEDGGKDEKYWTGQYGVKMIGAAVYAGQKHVSAMVDECTLM